LYTTGKGLRIKDIILNKSQNSVVNNLFSESLLIKLLKTAEGVFKISGLEQITDISLIL